MVNDRSPHKRRGPRGHYKSHSISEKVQWVKDYRKSNMPLNQFYLVA